MSSRRDEAPSFICDMSDHLRFLKASLKPQASNYTLKLPPEYRIHPKVHTRRLKQAYDNNPTLFPGHVAPKLPSINAGDNQYPVEAILDYRKARGNKKREFLVH